MFEQPIIEETTDQNGETNNEIEIAQNENEIQLVQETSNEANVENSSQEEIQAIKDDESVNEDNVVTTKHETSKPWLKRMWSKITKRM
uniref:Uncharacterized protein n=1 Tax=Meloidogyne hapla TaxID=6305 RepID=A0A1I8BCP5_MELHA